MDVFGFANFPFLGDSVKYVESLNFRLDDLFSDKIFQQVRERGKERVLSAFNEGIITKPSAPDVIGAEKELLSYPVSRILVSCINDGYLIRRYALAEAKSAGSLVKSLKDGDMKDLADDFGIFFEIRERHVVVHFTDYIRHASAIREPKWKLINRNMEHGKVALMTEDFSRIMEEAMRKRIESGLPVDVPAGLCAALETYLLEIRNALAARKTEFSIEGAKEIMSDCFPPCMAGALSGTGSGLNLPHSMRFALTSFLLNIGMKPEGIIELYRASPDFDEERTRYQVMHIQGATGTVYKSPSCATMITYGNCRGREPLCDRISHPLGYYRKKAWILKKGKNQE
ncbi:MAG TPA: DNA primase regulatory subunit PriL [Candidatus Methanoperedens sp.]